MDISNIKDKYTRKMHSKLDQWGAEIDALSAKADQAEAEARVEYHKQIAALHSKKDEHHYQEGKDKRTYKSVDNELINLLHTMLGAIRVPILGKNRGFGINRQRSP